MGSLFCDFLNNFENKMKNFPRNFRLLNSQINRGKSVSKNTQIRMEYGTGKANDDYINLLYCTYVRNIYKGTGH